MIFFFMQNHHLEYIYSNNGLYQFFHVSSGCRVHELCMKLVIHELRRKHALPVQRD